MRRYLGIAILLVVARPLGGQPPPRPLPDLSSVKAAEAPTAKTQAHLQPIRISAARGMDWLQRANQPDGRFLPGFVPALAAKTDSDAFVPQTEAALALLRAAHFERDDRALAIGK